MSLAATLKNSLAYQAELQARQMELAKAVTLDDQVTQIMRDTQLKIWQAIITHDINNGETNITLNLRSRNNRHCYLHNYEYTQNLKVLLETPEGVKFTEWLTENGLTTSFSKDHDGMGGESWETLYIKPI